MAIAAIVLHTDSQNLEEVKNLLKDRRELVDCRSVPPGRLAATIETPADRLLDVLQQIQDMPAIWNLELVYVNYEDDLESTGQIPCPPLADILRKAGKDS